MFRSFKGQDDWTNVVTACKRCNTRKGNRLLSECSMELLALPYRPNRAEYLALTHSGQSWGINGVSQSPVFERKPVIRPARKRLGPFQPCWITGVAMVDR